MNWKLKYALIGFTLGLSIFFINIVAHLNHSHEHSALMLCGHCAGYLAALTLVAMSIWDFVEYIKERNE